MEGLLFVVTCEWYLGVTDLAVGTKLHEQEF